MAINKRIVREAYDLPMGTVTCVKIVFETMQGKCPRYGHAKTFLPDEVEDIPKPVERIDAATTA